jgi:hypothetical protein
LKLGLGTGGTLRRLIPALAVTAVLGLSYLAQVPSVASVRDVGYGYGNNCGVKGSGYHDHGKVCPNRPFPGKGVDKSSVGATADTKVSEKTGSKVSDSSSATVTTVSTTSGSTTSAVTEDSQSADKSHGQGKGRGHGHGKGHSKGN